jgi:hypothetical protein
MVGDVVEFYCKAATFNGNIQLSDINSKTFGAQKFVVLAREKNSNGEVTPAYLEYFPDYNALIPPYTPYDLEVDTFNYINDFAPYAGSTIVSELEIRYIQPGDYDEDGNLVPAGDPYYFKEDTAMNVTIYARAKKADGGYFNLNIRVDGKSSPRLRGQDINPTHHYKVVGLLNPYFENYQIQFFNYKSAYLVDLGVI